MSAILAGPPPRPRQSPFPLGSNRPLDPHHPLVTIAAIGAGYPWCSRSARDPVQSGQAIQTIAAMNTVKPRLSWQPVTAINTWLASVTFRALK